MKDLKKWNKDANRMIREIMREEHITLKDISSNLNLSYNSLCQRFHHGNISLGLAKKIIESIGYKIGLWKNE